MIVPKLALLLSLGLRCACASDENFAPFSTVDPRTLNFLEADRPEVSLPGPATADVEGGYSSLPTNSWCQNLLIGKGENEANRVYQIPYIIDVAGTMTGIRTHPNHLYADSNQVLVQFEYNYAMTLGAVESESYDPQHQLVGDGDSALCSLHLGLQWQSADKQSRIQAEIARGSPYSSMTFFNASPRITTEQYLAQTPTVDGATALVCGNTTGVYSDEPVLVEMYVELKFIASDMTWLLFFSEPTVVECSNANNFFDLRAVKPMTHGMVRIALANNCTSGTNPLYCDAGSAGRDQSGFKSELILHADRYPTSQSSVSYTVDNEEEFFELVFDFKSESMSSLNKAGRQSSLVASESVELLTYALPHQQAQFEKNEDSSNELLSVGCTPTLHGLACPVVGSKWTLKQPLYPISFDFSSQAPREEMLSDLKAALNQDLMYKIPSNYMSGAGDTYFPGKMLAKLARIILIADSMGTSTDSAEFQLALTQLREGTEIWFNGSAAAPFLYDSAWGGLANCGCYYDEATDTCSNSYPNCPGLSDSGLNFGFGFYNDHHFHLGYHIYAAAVVAKFDPAWAAQNFEQVLLYVRDIANPSRDDKYFTTWRHKDWFLGASWASGVVMTGGEPYVNGRNEESSSEAVAAYEAVALFGQVCMDVVFDQNLNAAEYAVAKQVRDTGRVLVSTEITGAQTFWHVQSAATEGVFRIYPEAYENLVVGMLWSTLAQMQTWFGGAPYLCYGIQLIPITPVIESRDTLSWVTEMLPVLKQSCDSSGGCEADGWSIPVYVHMATTGSWEDAWHGVQGLSDDVFESSGGNGHSRTNTLWYIATH